MQELHKIPVILDGDPGHDDAIAWLLAASTPALDIKAITTVGGNCSLEKATYNAARICTLLNIDVPIAAGAEFPLVCEAMNAPSVHGESGLDGPALPEPTVEVSKLCAVEMMAKILRESDEPITLIPTGPLTNIAALLLAHPELKEKVARISLMGGGIYSGNWTPAAEFNILVDPEAAKIVFESGLPIIMAGLDVTERALVKEEDFKRIAALANPVADIVAEWLEFFYIFHKNIGYDGAPMHDPCAVMVLTHPEVFTIRPMYVQIETEGEFCRGATIADQLGLSGHAPNVSCILDLDREKFVDYLVDAVAYYGEVRA